MVRLLRSCGAALLLVLALTLTACAPTAAGSGPRNPLRLAGAGTIETSPGSTLFLSGSYSLADVGLTRDSLSDAFWIPDGVNQESSRALGVVELEVRRLPVYWQLDLAEARFVRRTGESGSVTNSLRVLLELTLPADAALGPQVIRAGLVTRSGEKVIEIPVRVRQAVP
jgi:hypothetical protein